MNTQRILFILIFVVSLLPLRAEEVRGRIMSDAGEPLAYCTVSLLCDSALLTGTVSDAGGRFVLGNVERGTYCLRISFVGYHADERTLRLTASKNVGDIILTAETQQLGEAVVTAKIPVVEQRIDKLVVNVDAMLSVQSDDAVELLRKSPGISIDHDGTVKLNGQAVAVWIDGRPSYLSGKDLEALLKGTPAATVEKIEIMAHPSAKYDAAGSGGIINLRLKRGRLNGLSGSVRGSYGAQPYKGHYFQNGNGSLMLSYRSPVSNTTLSYSGGPSQSMSETTNRFLSVPLDMRQEDYSLSYGFGQWHNGRLTNDFFINKHHTLGFIVSYNWMEHPNKQLEQYTRIFQADTLLRSGTMESEYRSVWDNLMANLNYTVVFDEAKSSELTVNADYIRSGTLHYNKYVSTYTKGNTVIPDGKHLSLNEIDNVADVYSAKADFHHTFNKMFSMEAGGKYAHSTTCYNNRWQEEEFRTGPQGTPSSDRLRYVEQIAALYASLAVQLDEKWSLKGGVRMEYTLSDGYWNDTVTQRDYPHFFPTVYAGYVPNEKHRFSLSYATRIERPSYWQLNPLKRSSEEHTYVLGNPDLMPTLTHTVQFTYGFDRYFSTSLIYMGTLGQALQMQRYDGLDRYFEWHNFGDQHVAALGIYLSELPLVKDWLTFTLSAHGMYVHYDMEYGGAGMVMLEDYFGGNLAGNLTLLLPKRFRMELNGWVQTPMVLPDTKLSWMGQMNFSIRKNFLKEDRLTLTLSVHDLLNTGYNRSTSAAVDGSFYEMTQRWSSPMVSLTVAYRFGKAEQAKYRNVGNVEESSRLGGGK